MRRLALSMLVAIATGGLASCNILVPAAFIFAPEPMVEPAYELPDRSTVVFVDDRQNLVTPTSLRRIIGNRVSQDLMVEEAVTTTIDASDAEAFARVNDTDGAPMAIDAIGRAVGADVVIYVEMVEFRDRTDPYQPKPRASCRVRVIDAVNRTRLFPDPSASEPSQLVQVELPAMNPDDLRSRAARNQVGELLANRLGQQAGRLFYEWNSNKIGTSLEGG